MQQTLQPPPCNGKRLSSACCSSRQARRQQRWRWRQGGERVHGLAIALQPLAEPLRRALKGEQAPRHCVPAALSCRTASAPLLEASKVAMCAEISNAQQGVQPKAPPAAVGVRGRRERGPSLCLTAAHELGTIRKTMGGGFLSNSAGEARHPLYAAACRRCALSAAARCSAPLPLAAQGLPGHVLSDVVV